MSALVTEFDAIDLGDARLDRRARRMLERLGDKPTLSIPATCGGWAETQAAYRLFDHPKVTAEAVLAPHIERTLERIRAQPRVLCIQDTSEIDYTSKPSMEGLGPLNLEVRQGLYLHPTLAVTPDRVCLGLLMSTPSSASRAVSARTKIPIVPWRRRRASAGWMASARSTNWPSTWPAPAPG